MCVDISISIYSIYLYIYIYMCVCVCPRLLGIPGYHRFIRCDPTVAEFKPLPTASVSWEDHGSTCPGHGGSAKHGQLVGGPNAAV